MRTSSFIRKSLKFSRNSPVILRQTWRNDSIHSIEPILPQASLLKTLSLMFDIYVQRWKELVKSCETIWVALLRYIAIISFWDTLLTWTGLARCRGKWPQRNESAPRSFRASCSLSSREDCRYRFITRGCSPNKHEAVKQRGRYTYGSAECSNFIFCFPSKSSGESADESLECQG